MPLIDQHIIDRLDRIISNTEPVQKFGGRIKYYNTAVTVNTPGEIKIEDTAETSFYNNGTSTLVVINIPLLPGQGIAFTGNENEQDMTKYRYSFTGAGVNSAIILQKLYING